MKQKQKDLDQYLYHEIEDEVKAEEFLKVSLPLIGAVVMHFNGLESELDSALCQTISDRSDSFGLLVLHKMQYATKVDLFQRFCDDFHRVFTTENEFYLELISNLKEVGRLRNIVVHADWESTDEEGFTFVKVQINKQGIKQEYTQFSQDSLDKIVDLIGEVRQQLDNYWEKRGEIFASW
jgi:hypothetical protein